MISHSPRSIAAASMLVFLLPSAPLSAASTPLGNFAGDNVLYEDVSEDSGGLFSTPTISGDTLDFTSGLSTGFEAESSGGTPDTVSGLLAGQVTAKAGRAITDFTIEASGLFNLIHGAGGFTADTAVRAEVNVIAQVVAVDGTDLVGGPQALAPLAAILDEADLSQGAQTSASWGGSATLDIAARAQSELGITGEITKVLWSIDTTLSATSLAGTQSNIGLRGFDTLTLTVPEPASLSLILAPLGLISLRRLRPDS